ncbi:MAG: murein transglycosylase domain-containing protein [Desulfobacteraceae bacterium]|jgi:membrane-bound lytic murein transglycosylase C
MEFRHVLALILLFCGTVIPLTQNTARAEESFSDFVKQERAAFHSYLDEQERDYAAYVEEVRAKWGEFLGSTKKVWVDYGDQKESRSVVDFEQGNVIIDVIVSKKAEESFEELARQKIKSQLKRMVSDKWPTGENPLDKQVEASEGETLDSGNVDKFIKERLKDKLSVKPTPVPDKGDEPQQVVSVKIPMVPEHLRIRAEKYKTLVDKYCEKRNLSSSVVYGLIHTESYFNPMARSHIPAFGLMQIVPASGGRDAYKHVYKEDKKPSAEYLYDPENNINLGTAYLNLTKDVYFKGIENTTTAYLLTIAAYNTGPGNVAKAITGSTRLGPTIEKANGMSIEEVHKALRNKLPYKETQKYVQKVFSRSKLYRGM